MQIQERSTHQTPDIIREAEAAQPTITAEFKKLQHEEYELFCKKTLSYGIDNIALGQDVVTNDDNVKLSLTGIWFRITDKMQRLKGLLVYSKNEHLTDETIEDTLKDISNYCNIAQILKNRKWKK